MNVAIVKKRLTGLNQMVKYDFQQDLHLKHLNLLSITYMAFLLLKTAENELSLQNLDKWPFVLIQCVSHYEYYSWMCKP